MGISKSILVISLAALALIGSSCTTERSAFTYRRPYQPAPWGEEPYYGRTPPPPYYKAQPKPGQPSPEQPVPPTGESPPEQSQEKLAPRARASLQLTHQGRTLLQQGKLDDAISVLERAVGLDSNNGQNYYYLAECWISKGNKAQAQELNRLAGLYLTDPAWLPFVSDQRERINRMKK